MRGENLSKREDTSFKSATYPGKPKLLFKDICPRIGKMVFDVLEETGGWEGCGHASNAKPNGPKENPAEGLSFRLRWWWGWVDGMGG
jgi:hypothetical protein